MLLSLLVDCYADGVGFNLVACQRVTCGARIGHMVFPGQTGNALAHALHGNLQRCCEKKPLAWPLVNVND